MVTPTNHVITGPDLHFAGPLVLWGLLQRLPAKSRRRPKKILTIQGRGPRHT